MGKGYIQPWEPVVPAAQGIDRMRDRAPRGLTRGTARQTNVNSGPAPGRVILQLPDLYGNIISYALDVMIEPGDKFDARARKLQAHPARRPSGYLREIAPSGKGKFLYLSLIHI